jgi:hypothetical protein
LKRAEYLTSIILLLDLLSYGRQDTPADKADTNIDGNEDHMANTDEILFDGYQCDVSKYRPVLDGNASEVLRHATTASFLCADATQK